MDLGEFKGYASQTTVFTNHPGSCQNADLTPVWACVAATSLTSSQVMPLPPALPVQAPHCGDVGKAQARAGSLTLHLAAV